MCVRGHAHSRSAWAENIANVWLPYTYGKTSKCHNFNSERRESTIPAVKFLVLIHSVCTYTNHVLKCSQIPHNWLIFFYYLVFVTRDRHTKQKKKKKLSRNHHRVVTFKAIYKHMGNTVGAITLILRRESKFFQVKVLVFLGFFFHSVCTYKNYGLKCFLESCESHYLMFFPTLIVCNFLVSKNFKIFGGYRYRAERRLYHQCHRTEPLERIS